MELSESGTGTENVPHFQDHKGHNDEVRESSVLEFFVTKGDDVFQANIPVDCVREMPKRMMYPFALALQVTVVAIFIWLVQQGEMDHLIFPFLHHNDHHFQPKGYVQGLQPFISSVSEGSGMTCQPVSAPLTGTFTATSLGQWQGASNFSYNNAIYSFTFDNFTTTNAEFKQRMLELQNTELRLLGLIANQQNLAMNLLIWMSYSHTFTWSGNSQTFSFTGTPSMVFKAMYIVPYITNSDSPKACPYIPGAFFTHSVAEVNIVMDYAYISRHKNCVTNFTYPQGPNLANFVIKVDMRSLVTSLAVNIGYLSLSDLEIASSAYAAGCTGLEYNGNTYNCEIMFDPSYPAMTPLWCFSQQNATLRSPPFLCMAYLYGHMMLPIMHSAGVNQNGSPDIADWTYEYCSW